MSIKCVYPVNKGFFLCFPFKRMAFKIIFHKEKFGENICDCPEYLKTGCRFRYTTIYDNRG